MAIMIVMLHLTDHVVVQHETEAFCVSNRVFFEMHKNDNNANIGKMASNKILNPVSIEQ